MSKTTAKSFPRVFGYVRVSDKASADAGISSAMQVERIVDYKNYKLRDYKWADGCYPESYPNGIFCDLGVSAWSESSTSSFESRPGSRLIMEQAKAGDHIVFYTLDRGFRSVSDYAFFMRHCGEKGITVHFMDIGVDTRTAAGKLYAQMVAATAEYYSDIISERIREAIALRKEGKGKRKEIIRTIPGENHVVRNEKADSSGLTGRLIPYIRVSTSQQVEKALGLECQREGVVRECQYLLANNPGLTWDGEVRVDAGISAYKVPLRERPDGKRIFEEMQKGDIIVAYRLDRLFRNFRDMEDSCRDFENAGVRFQTVADGINSKTQKPMLQLLALFAQMESDLKSQRQKDILAWRRKNGMRAGGEMPNFHKYIYSGNTRKLGLDLNELTWNMVMFHLRSTGLSLMDAMKKTECIRATEEGRRPLLVNYTRRDASSYGREASMNKVRASIGPVVWRDCQEEAIRRLFSPPLPGYLEMVGYTGMPPKRPRIVESPIADLLNDELGNCSAASVPEVLLGVSEGADSDGSLAGEPSSSAAPF